MRLLARVTEDGDETQVRVVDANKREADILLRESLDRIENESQDQIKIAHVLSNPQKKGEWEKNGGLSGHVDADIIKSRLFPPVKEASDDGEDQVVTFLWATCYGSEGGSTSSEGMLFHSSGTWWVSLG